ncbi:ATP-dependent helicase [Candidatus Woesearchaeota archaeon]|nr:ATP-dependent helicase [Candidatus Woesearchaeota archaeon]
MIAKKTKPDSIEAIDNILHPLVKKWFYQRFSELSLPQKYAVLDIHSRQNILISAPTGATKTLTAFLAILNELVDASIKGILEDRTYVVYISPLKALNYDIQINLLQPLKEIEALHGKPLNIRVGVRTGDTTTKEKQQMLKNPPHILITTPESLSILLTSIKFSKHLEKTEWMIIDEIHALAESKRGVHLSLTMEALSHVAPHICRVGLSATISPIEDIAQYLAGTNRDCSIVDIQFIKELDLKVICPTADLINIPYEKVQHAMYEKIHNLVREHKTTVIFTNTRAATERIVHTLKDRYPKFYNENIGAHHGSLSKELRFRIEENMRQGKMKVVVSSTSLELGIDIGYIDLVILLGSPKSVARALQRCGRAGHKLHKKSKGRIMVLDRDDLVECSVLLKHAIEKKIDRIHIPVNCLDVLSQQIIGIILMGRLPRLDLFELVRESYCFKNLSIEDFDQVIDYLAGKHVTLEDRYVYAKIYHNEETDMISRKGKMTRVIYMTNIGTIPDESHVLVKIGDQIIGTIDEGFLERLKKSDVFVLGGSTYEFRYAKGMVAQVSASGERPPTVPNWFSEMLPLSFDLAMGIGRLRRLIEDRLRAEESKEDIVRFLQEYLYIDENSSTAMYKYFKEQYKFARIPTDKKITIEIFTDREQTYYFFHTMYGRRVNDCISRAVAFAIARIDKRAVEIGINDNGFYITSQKRIQPIKAFSFLKSDKLETVLKAALEKTEVLRRRFRHNAQRSFMILRTYKGKTKEVGRQQVSSQILINAAKEISDDFPILKEARREVLEDLMDIENAKQVLKSIEDGSTLVQEVQVPMPSPFSFNLMLQGISDILKMEDRMQFLNRMHDKVMESIAAKGKVKISMKEEWDKLKDHQPLSFKQRKLLRMLAKTDMPDNTKFAFEKIIKGAPVRKDTYDQIKSQQQLILDTFPDELAYFILKEAEKEFSYDEFWNNQNAKDELEEENRKLQLIEDLQLAAKRTQLPADIIFDIQESIIHPTHKLSELTEDFIRELTTGTVPQCWSDSLIKHLRDFLR